MLIILYSADVNWFHETLANDVHRDLTVAGIESRLATAEEFMAMNCDDQSQSDVIIINFREVAHGLAGPTISIDHCQRAMGPLYARLRRFRRRILLNVDGIHTRWFQSQFEVAGEILTEIFDICMVSQTPAARVAGCGYRWIPEGFTAAQRDCLARKRGERRIPWAVIGHHTPERVVVADALTSLVASNGFVFLPGLRPVLKDGTRNISPEALNRILTHTDFYVWSSHHQFPYHEGLRAIHALQQGAVPVKIDPLFGYMFREIPWVFESVDKFAASLQCRGVEALYKCAMDFVLDRRTLGEYLAEAL